MPNINTKTENFIRLAEARTNKIIDMINLLGNLSNKSNQNIILSPLNKFDIFEQDIINKIYTLFLMYYYNISYTRFKNIKVFLYYPSKNVLDNETLYDTLTNDEQLFYNIFIDRKNYLQIIKDKYPDIYNLNVLKSYVNTVLGGTVISLDNFKKYYNILFDLLDNTIIDYEKYIYTGDINHLMYITAENLIYHATEIQKDLHLIYKYNKHELVSKFEKYNLSVNELINECIFYKYKTVYIDILKNEKLYMNILNEFRNI